MPWYRQIVHRLRLEYGPGTPHRQSERPRNKRTGVFLDSDDEPTLVELTGTEININVDMLIAAGGLVPVPAPKPVSEPTAEAPAKPGRKGGA